MRSLVVVTLAFACAAHSWAQSPEAAGDHVRGLWSTEFRNARVEAGKKPAPPRPAGVAPPVTGPAPSAAAPAKPGKTEPSMIGVTVWHLRPSRAADSPAVRAIVHEKSDRPHTPVRVSSQTRFFEGDHLRLTIESGRTGFLYVVSRERYKDGSAGPQQLIFPTMRLRNGDNRVRAGYPVEIPSGADDPSYFTMRRSRPDHVGEEILFIVAPRPIGGITIAEDPLELSESLVKSWREKWVTKVQSIETPASQEQPLTSEEVKLLRAGNAFQDTDPLPQTLYRVDSQPDQPFLVSLQLKMTP